MDTQFKVDNYNHFDNDPSSVQRFIQKQNELFEAESAKWKSITEEYYQISASRRDDRSSTVPEVYDNYEYYTKVAWKNGREYSIIFRRKLQGGNEEKVLDIMQYPQINRYFKTVELLRTSFSPSHRFIGFGVDIRNDQRVSFFIADTALQESNQKLDGQIKDVKQNIRKILSEIAKLNHLDQNSILQMKNMKENTTKLSQQLNKMPVHIQKMVSDINLLYGFLMNEDLAKRYYQIMIKNSKKINFQINKINFNNNYSFKNQNIITKINYQKNNIFVYTQKPLLRNQLSYFSVRIQKIEGNDISIGVFSDKKLSQLQCAYCQSQTMYYIYSNNAYMYHGTFLNFFYSSTKSTILRLKEKDIITVFYQQQWKRIIFYVNEIYVGHILLKKEDHQRQIYPFIVMESKDNQISLI